MVEGLTCFRVDIRQKLKRGVLKAPLFNISPSPLKERGIKGVR